MKKFAYIFLFVTALVLTGELVYSPLLHNHNDLIEHKDCPAYLIVSHQYSVNPTFSIVIEFSIPFFSEITPFEELQLIPNPSLHTLKNKEPPVV